MKHLTPIFFEKLVFQLRDPRILIYELLCHSQLEPNDTRQQTPYIGGGIMRRPRANGRIDWVILARSTAFTIFRDILVPNLFPSSRRITVNLAILGKFRGENGGGREHRSLLAAGDFRLSLPGKSGDGWCPASREPEPTWFPR